MRTGLNLLWILTLLVIAEMGITLGSVCLRGKRPRLGLWGFKMEVEREMAMSRGRDG